MKPLSLKEIDEALCFLTIDGPSDGLSSSDYLVTLLFTAREYHRLREALEKYAYGRYEYGVFKDEEELPYERWNNESPYGSVAREALRESEGS